MNKTITAKDCLQILRSIKDVAFATVDKEGHPHNRIIDVMLIEENTLYFCTARGKNFYEELITSKRVAIVGLNPEYKMISLRGSIQKLDHQKKWIDKIFEANQSMNTVYPGDSRYILEAFCIADAEIEWFDLGVNPIYRKSFTTGNEKITPKGFFITEDCIQCDTCASGCPQQCITSGEPYLINQENCLHCGYCFENCPVSAIIKKQTL